MNDRPTVLRIPKDVVPVDIAAVSRRNGMDVLRGGAAADVLVVSVGSFAATCLAVAEQLEADRVSATVVDPRWVIPVNEALVELARDHRLVVVVEDGATAGGVGDAVAAALREAEVQTPVLSLGVPAEFIDHASRAEILADLGLDAGGVSGRILARLRSLTSMTDPTHELH